MSRKALWESAESIRKLFNPHDKPFLPIMDILEFRLPTLLEGFVLDVQTREELGGDEAITYPAENRIVFRADVYDAAWKKQGRARSLRVTSSVTC